jgi:hypothetical protein
MLQVIKKYGIILPRHKEKTSIFGVNSQWYVKNFTYFFFVTYLLFGFLTGFFALEVWGLFGRFSDLKNYLKF